MGLLIRAVYLSEVNIAGSELLPQIRAIHEVATRRNGEAGITGVLLFSDRFFLQMLEGPRLRVTETLGRIFADHRHDNIRLCRAEEVHSRMFPNWSMRLVDRDPNFRLNDRQQVFDPSMASADEIVAMIVRGCALAGDEAFGSGGALAGARSSHRSGLDQPRGVRSARPASR